MSTDPCISCFSGEYDGGKETREEGSGSWNLVGSRITGRCVKLMTLNEHLLGGNPTLFLISVFSPPFYFLVCVCWVDLNEKSEEWWSEGELSVL